MNLAEITERFVRAVNGGKAKNEGISYPYIESLVPKYRQRAILIAYNGSREFAGNRFIPNEWYQSFTLEIPLIQNTDTTKNYLEIDCPSPARLNSSEDGCIFTGDNDLTIGFTRIASISYASDLTKRGDLNQDQIGYVLVGNKIRFYGNKQLRSAGCNWVMNDPLDVADFDIDGDYPVSEDVIEIMESLARAELGQIMGMPEDLIKDGTDTKDRRINKANVA